MPGDHVLVGRHDVDAGFQGARDHVTRRFDAADRLDDDVALFQQGFVEPRVDQRAREVGDPRTARRAHDDSHDLEVGV